MLSLPFAVSCIHSVMTFHAREQKQSGVSEGVANIQRGGVVTDLSGFCDITVL